MDFYDALRVALIGPALLLIRAVYFSIIKKRDGSSADPGSKGVAISGDDVSGGRNRGGGQRVLSSDGARKAISSGSDRRP